MTSLVPQEPVVVPHSEVSEGLSIFEYSGSPIQFDMVNGKLMANFKSMCKAFGKRSKTWLRNKYTQELIEAITKTRINLFTDNQIVTVLYSGNTNGTWIDQELIIDAAGWLDVNFRMWCNDRIAELLRTGTTSIQKKLIFVY